jgi:hypothetical protein
MFPATAAWSVPPPLAGGSSKHLALLDEEREIFSSVLEFMYKGDHQQRLVHDKKRNVWRLKQIPTHNRGRDKRGVESNVYIPTMNAHLLKDTVMHCAAQRYGLEDLKRFAFRSKSRVSVSAPTS